MKKSILLRWVHAGCDVLGQAFSHVPPDAGITGAAGEFAPTVVTVIREIGTMYDAVAAVRAREAAEAILRDSYPLGHA